MKKKLLIVGLSMLFTCLSNAQHKYELAGQVLDSLTKEPMARALVYLTPTDKEDFLAYANTNNEGVFTLVIDAEAGEQFLMHVSYLGYEKKSYPVVPSSAERYTVYLTQKDVMINEIVVSDRRSSITQQSDTTSYHLSDFLDSTEYNVEDILKKLPGIEVQEDGSVKAFGKEISKVLIEGDDLFGRKYQIGTKNIRAGYIDRIDIIDRFQENTVLRNVNTSEDIVVNLFIKEDKKYQLNGTYDLFLGAGLNPELKGGIRSNIFMINKKRKAIFLLDNTNFGNLYTPTEMDHIYGNFDQNDIKNNPFNIQGQQMLGNIQNPGLSAVNIDNSITGFNTVRLIENLSNDLSLNINATLTGKKGRQSSFSRQTYFLDESSYDVAQRSDMSLRRLSTEGNVLLNKISKDKNSNFKFFGEWQQSRNNNLIYNSLTREGETLQNNIAEKTLPMNFYLAGQYSTQIAERSVVLLQMRTASAHRPQVLLSENNDYAVFFLQDPEYFAMEQKLKYNQKNIDFSAKYITSFANSIVELEGRGVRGLIIMENDLHLVHSYESQNVVISDRQDTIQSDRLQMKANWRVGLRKGYIQLNYSISSIWHTAKIQPFVYQGIANSAFAAWNRELSETSKINIGYSYSEDNPNGQDFITIPYFTSAISYNLAEMKDRKERGHNAFFSYNYRNIYKYLSGNVNVRYRFAEKFWLQNADFLSSISVFSPYFSEGNNYLMVSTLWDYYIKSIIARIKVNGSYSRGGNNMFIQANPYNFGSEGYNCGVTFSKPLLEYFHTTFESGYSERINFDIADKKSSSTAVRTWKNELNINFTINSWRIEANGVSLRGRSDLGNRIDLLSTRLGVRNEFTVKGKKMILALNLYNLLNTKEYISTSNSTLFLFETGVEALSAFFIVSMDYAF